MAVAIVATFPECPPSWYAAMEALLAWVQSLIPQPATLSISGETTPSSLKAPLEQTVASAPVDEDLTAAIVEAVGSSLVDFCDLWPMSATTEVYAGQSVQVSGTGFTPQGSLTMAFGLPGADSPLVSGTGVARDDGSVCLSIPVEVQAEPGTYLLMLLDESSALESLRQYDAAGGSSLPRFRLGATLVTVLRDELPPTTTVQLLPAEPDGLAGWYVTPVEVALTASDANLSVAKTMYRIDEGAWCEYEGPFALSDGFRSLEYYSVDTAGNTEIVNEVSLPIDCTPPRTFYEGPKGWVNSAVTFTVSAEDDTSGVAAIHVTVNGMPEAPGDGQCVSTSLCDEGYYDIVYWADDVSGNACEPSEAWLGIDLTAPVVTAKPDRPPNERGWYSAPVEVAFEAFDPPLADGSPASGIASVSPAALIATEGVGVRSEGEAVDVAGNAGRASLELNIDMTPPTLDVDLVGGPAYIDNERLTLLVAADDELSGLVALTNIVDGTYEVGPSGLDLWSLPLGTHEVVTVARDAAGNTTRVATDFTTTASLAGLAVLKHRFASLGWLGETPGLVKSLDAHLDAASRALARQQLTVFKNVMGAFINEVEASKGRIDPRAAEVLLRDARFLVENPG